MSFREKLAAGVQMGMAMGSLYLGGNLQASENVQTGGIPATTVQVSQNKDYSALIRSNTPEEQIELRQIVDMMAETKTGRELLDFMKANGTTIDFGAPAHENSKACFQKSTNAIHVRKGALQGSLLPFLWVLSHEAEHARHITIEEQKGYAAHSSLNDAHIATTIHEALSERSACSVTLEYLAKHPEMRSLLPNNFSLEGKRLGDPAVRWEAQKGMIYELDLEHRNGKPLSEVTDGVFNRRMSLKGTPHWDTHWLQYEGVAAPNSNSAPPKTMQDWNKIVSEISQGRVSEIKDLPVVSSSFIRRCISSDIQKDPNVSSLNNLNLSCAQRNRQRIKLDENDTKDMVISTLFEIQAQQDIPKELSDKINKFLGVELSDDLKSSMDLMDCSQDREYIEKTAQAKKNLEQYSAGECLNKTLALLNTPESQAFLKRQEKDSEISKKVKTAEFMKEFLLPFPTTNMIMMKRGLTK